MLNRDFYESDVKIALYWYIVHFSLMTILRKTFCNLKLSLSVPLWYVK